MLNCQGKGDSVQFLFAFFLEIASRLAVLLQRFRASAPQGNGTDPGVQGDLTSGSVPRQLAAFTVPILVGSLCQTAYAFVNAVWVGRFLGKEALAAVTVGIPIFFVCFAIGGGLCVAAGILSAQSFGARSPENVRRVTDSSFVLGILLSIALVGAVELGLPQLLALLGTPHEVLPHAMEYCRIFMLMLPFSLCMTLLRNLLQGIGDSRTPMVFTMGTLALAAVLDPVFMLGLCGFPRLGLNGTAWATVFANALFFLAFLFHPKVRGGIVFPRFRHVHLDSMITCLRIGAPATLQQVTMALTGLFMTGVVNQFGGNATAAWGVTSRIDQVALLPAVALSMAIAAMVGQNVGAGNLARVREIFLWGTLFSIAATSLVACVTVAFPASLIRMFVDDPMVISHGVTYLRIVGGAYVISAIGFAATGVICGAGRTLPATFISLVTLWLVRIPLAYWVVHAYHSFNGVIYTAVLGVMVEMALSLAYYAKGSWRQPIGLVPGWAGADGEVSARELESRS